MSSVWLAPDLKAIRAGRMPRTLAPGGGLASLWTDAPLEKLVLRRSGERPMTFSGMRLLGHENEVEDPSQRRHSIRLYETVDGVFVVEITLFSADGSTLPHSLATEVASLGEAEAFLNAYDPAGQAALALTVDRTDEASLAVATMADALRADAERLRQDFEMARAALFAAARNDDTSQRVN